MPLTLWRYTLILVGFSWLLIAAVSAQDNRQGTGQGTAHTANPTQPEQTQTIPPKTNRLPTAKLSLNPDDDNGRYIFSITLHTAAEIDAMLSRAEKLARQLRPEEQQTQLALVLHGSEIDIFSKKNFPRYRALIERAAKLDAQQVIDIKACATQMRALNLEQEDLPSFIEIVPYGPDEEQRLRDKGYVEL